MIASLRGEITQVEDTAVIIDVGGVGMRVFVPAPLRDKLKTRRGRAAQHTPGRARRCPDALWI